MMNKELLLKAKSETLQIVKVEAERNLSGILNADEVITNKSNTLMQVLIPIFLLVFGFLVKSISDTNFTDLFFVSIPLSVLLGIVIYKLYRNILPVKSAIAGSEPNQIFRSDIITGGDEERNVLLHRIWSLNKAIESSLCSHRTRYKRFADTNKVLFVGLLVILIGTMILVSFRLFHFFQCR